MGVSVLVYVCNIRRHTFYTIYILFCSDMVHISQDHTIYYVQYVVSLILILMHIRTYIANVHQDCVYFYYNVG